jgi:hypothetical protein
MASRKARDAGFVGAAASSFRATAIAGLLGFAVLSTPVWAQMAPIPGLGAGTGIGGTAASALGAGVAAPAAAPRTLWGFLGLSPDNLKACRDKLCACQIGQMANSLLTGPVGAISGGFLCPLCPPAPSPAQIAALEKKPNGGAEAAAAKIKASEADAKARVAAVEYLSTVDCNRFPEAKKGLISALREDPNECVRFAAARALNSGCCCDQEVIEQLRICVAGEKKGAPAETSPRVKAAAFAALQNCLMRVPEEVEAPQRGRAEPEGGKLPEALPEEKKRAKPEGSTMNTTDPAAVVTSLSATRTQSLSPEGEPKDKSFGHTVAEARRTLFEAARHPQQATTLTPGRRSVFDAFIKARKDIDAKARQNPGVSGPSRDSAVEPSSYVPTSPNGPGQADLVPTQVPGAEASSPGEAPKPIEAPQPTNPSKRGLFGLLIKSRDSG